MKCDQCGKEEMMPYTCSYCEHTFCAAHHLPENHDCKGMGTGKQVKKERVSTKVKRKASTFTYNNEDDFID